ncbi:UNVERIFIED_CONTAM: hypothetical protein Sradi_3008900 [Sesamum radiatum]|uniref:Reverse transcriptase domain-containing protein n=1 Tax=Sesamum radiatum TaxID=300843 RepID=A0AAW2S335_SESRA
MKGVLDLIVDPSQNAFLPGLKINDNLFLAQELLAGYNQNYLPPGCSIKVDLRKAYDSIDWNYLSADLDLFQFPIKFKKWVFQCVSTAG